jgi:glyoxylase-like metal-dependent hydrolase (beta-lactamase superfamily II)
MFLGDESMHDAMNRRNFLGWGVAAGAAFMAPRLIKAQAAAAAKPAAKPSGPAESKPVKVTKLYDNLYLLEGTGGNMALQTGTDGNLLIDSSYTADLPRIREAIASVAPDSASTPGILVNTHQHSDHTGSNEGLHAAGFTIFAHQHTRARLSAPQVLKAFNKTNPAAPAGALPTITLNDAMQVWRNGEQIDLVCFEPAHTDGDVYIHFHKADVLHMGDVWFNGLYPFIDGDAGGSIAGMVRACDKALTLVGSSTKIIPGHGPVGAKDRLQVYRDMLATVRDRVGALKTAGASEQEAVAKKPTADLDAAWASSFINGDKFVSLVYQTL